MFTGTCELCEGIVEVSSGDVLSGRRVFCPECRVFEDLVGSTEMDRWKDNLEDARALRGKSAKLTYQRGIKLREVYKSQGFMDHCVSVNRERHAVLDEELGDINVSFKVLMRALDLFPHKRDWDATNIRTLLAKAVEEEKGERESRQGSRQRVSWKSRCVDVERERDEAVSRLSEMQTQYAEMEQQYEELLAKYDGLRSHLPAAAE